LFAFPVPDGQRPMGVLELYRRSAGSLADAPYAAAVGCAAAIGGRLQSNWDEQVARVGSAEKAVEAAAARSASPSERDNPFTRTQIYVASGMVAIQLGVDPTRRSTGYALIPTRVVVASPPWQPISSPADSHCTTSLPSRTGDTTICCHQTARFSRDPLGRLHNEQGPAGRCRAAPTRSSRRRTQPSVPRKSGRQLFGQWSINFLCPTGQCPE
jgi:hypothetical protein